MQTDMWPDDTGLPGTVDWPDGGWADQDADSGPWSEPHAAPLADLPPELPRRTPGTARAEPRPGPLWGQPAPVRSCWMCGIRMPADQMVADGGSACADLRWYCLDTWGCTERWTSRSARLVAIRPEAAEPPKERDGQGTGADAAQPVSA